MKIHKFILLYIILTAGLMNAQQQILFFSDSPAAGFYDLSWGFANPPSQLELVNGSKFPVETGVVFSGANSLRLRWTSASGGDWAMAVASSGWTPRDFSQLDTLSFWAYSSGELTQQQMPAMFLEDRNNNKTPKQKLSSFVSVIKAGLWQKISVPLAIFKQLPGSADLKNIKTIFFGQDAADAKQHTLYIDEIIVYKTTDAIKPSVPSGIDAEGYEKHIDISWQPGTEKDIAGYRVFKYENGAFRVLVSTEREMTGYTDFLGVYDSTARYAVAAFDSSGNQSDLSMTAEASTVRLNDEQLLDMLQRSTFRYFWDYAHPVSGLARERAGSGDIVTTGGSGFGVMAILTGIERGFVTRQQAAGRLFKMADFLYTKADRFHGVFPHWMNGVTGRVRPFSQYDNGGDLVETAFMMQGLLTVRQYFTPSENAVEDSLVKIINKLWQETEWSWYRQLPYSTALYWHWSPDYGWKMNMKVTGYNEALIVYVLAAASPTYPVPASLYHYGWAGEGSYVNNNSYYGYRLFVGYPYGGPLFLAHYSFLGLDPRNKKDKYANYFTRNRNHTLIHRAYAIDNPKKFPGYSENIWGFTSSDDPWGYLQHEPLNGDNGTIAPTAALSSMPYTPQESIAAFKAMYNQYGKRLWGYLGFKDAFNVKENWFADSYIAIDQGPIIDMVENYRSGLLWNNFMKNPEVADALSRIGFVPDTVTAVADNKVNQPAGFTLKGNYPNPFNPATLIEFYAPERSVIRIDIFDIRGEKITTLINSELPAGDNRVLWTGRNDTGQMVSSGVYLYSVMYKNSVLHGKMVLQK